jgi:hypothetical protein
VKLDVKIIKLPVVADALAKYYIEEYGLKVKEGQKVHFMWGAVKMTVFKKGKAYVAVFGGLFNGEIRARNVNSLFQTVFFILFAKAKGVDEGGANVLKQLQKRAPKYIV